MTIFAARTGRQKAGRPLRRFPVVGLAHKDDTQVFSKYYWPKVMNDVTGMRNASLSH